QPCRGGLARCAWSVGFAVVVVSGEVTGSATGITCSAIALIFGKGLLRTMGQCGHIFAPRQRFCASLTILYHPWRLSASPPEKRPLSDQRTPVLPGIACVCRGRPEPQSRRQALHIGS